jgi:hypothetical protein
MLGELSIFAGGFLGVLTLVLTSVFGGEAHQLVLELVRPGEAVEVSVTQEDEAQPIVTVEKEVVMPPTTFEATVSETPSPSATAEPEPTVAAAATELDDEECISGEDLDVSADGSHVRVNVEGAQARVCASGDEGDSRIEANVESDSADVEVKQRVESSGNTSVNSKFELNVSTN